MPLWGLSPTARKSAASRPQIGDNTPSYCNPSIAEMDHLPRFRVAPDFLQSNSQAHPNPLSAWADLIDNPREAGATSLWIDVKQLHKVDIVVVKDNGCGMTEGTMATGIMGALSQPAAAALVSHPTTALLLSCAPAPASPLHRCTTPPLHRCTTPPLHHCTTSPPNIICQ